jgi:hypothetical protein
MDALIIPSKLVGSVRLTMEQLNPILEYSQTSQLLISKNSHRKGDRLIFLLFNIALKIIVTAAAIKADVTIFYKPIQTL